MLAGKKGRRKRESEERRREGWKEGRRGRRKGRERGKGGRKDSLLSEYLRNSVTLAHTRYPLSTQNPALDQRRKKRHKKRNKGLKKLKVHLNILSYSCLRGSPTT